MDPNQTPQNNNNNPNNNNLNFNFIMGSAPGAPDLNAFLNNVNSVFTNHSNVTNAPVANDLISFVNNQLQTLFSGGIFFFYLFILFC